jgi:hypothetical protein
MMPMVLLLAACILQLPQIDFNQYLSAVENTTGCHVVKLDHFALLLLGRLV